MKSLVLVYCHGLSTCKFGLEADAKNGSVLIILVLQLYALPYHMRVVERVEDGLCLMGHSNVPGRNQVRNQVLDHLKKISDYQKISKQKITDLALSFIHSLLRRCPHFRLQGNYPSKWQYRRHTRSLQASEKWMGTRGLWSGQNKFTCKVRTRAIRFIDLELDRLIILIYLAVVVGGGGGVKHNAFVTSLARLVDPAQDGEEKANAGDEAS